MFDALQTQDIVWIGLGLAGQALFRPEMARTYRAVAYLVFTASALAGLPLFGD